jgi:phosphonate transport system permease protein
MNRSAANPPYKLPPRLFDARCKACWFVAGLLVLVVLSFWTLDLQWAQFFSLDAARSMGRFIKEFFPPDLSPAFVHKVAIGAVETLAMSLLGTALAVAVPMTLLSVRVLSVSALSGRMARGPFWLRQWLRWMMIVLRSIPELVWALVFVRVVGLGPTSGVLAIALTYGGMLGKVYAEILESGETHPTETLLRNGSSA